VAPAVLLALAAACAPRAAPVRPIAPSAFTFAVDSFRPRVIGNGLTHASLYAKTGPWAIHVLDVQLDKCLSAVAAKGVGSAVGRIKTTEILARLERERQDVLGGVNADFFSLANGVPTNALVIRGRVLTPPSRQPVFAVDSAGRPHIVNLVPLGDAAFTVDDPALARVSLAPFHPMEAVGGRPRLVRDSVIVPEVDTEGQAGFANSRHPRTAIGIANNGKRLFVVVVDGRQAGFSAGMTLRELANVMLALGARDALNLDGGGSTTMVVENPATKGLEIVNRPSDPTGVRTVGDALAIVRGCRQ
jgi:hypothetical protein